MAEVMGKTSGPIKVMRASYYDAWKYSFFSVFTMSVPQGWDDGDAVLLFLGSIHLEQREDGWVSIIPNYFAESDNLTDHYSDIVAPKMRSRLKHAIEIHAKLGTHDRHLEQILASSHHFHLSCNLQFPEDDLSSLLQSKSRRGVVTGLWLTSEHHITNPIASDMT